MSSPETGSVPSIPNAVPVNGPDGAVIGVVAVWVRAAPFWALVRGGNGRAAAGSFSILYDRYGVRVAESADDREIFHPAGPLDPGTIDALVLERRFGAGTRALLQAPIAAPVEFERALAPKVGGETLVTRGNVGVARRLGTAPWTLLHLAPEAALEQAAERLEARAAARSGAILAAALLLGMLLVGRILAPARDLSRLAERAAELERGAARHAAFGRAAAALAGAGPLEEVVDAALAHVAPAAGAVLLICYRLDAGGALAPFAAFAATEKDRTTTIAAEGLAAEALARGAAFHLDPLPPELDLRYEAAIAGGRPRAAALVPLPGGDPAVGLLVACALGPFSAEARALLDDLARPLGETILRHGPAPAGPDEVPT